MSMLSLYTELRPFIKKFPIGKLLSVFVSNIIKTLTFLNLLRNVNLFTFFSRITFLVCHCITFNLFFRWSLTLFKRVGLVFSEWSWPPTCHIFHIFGKNGNWPVFWFIWVFSHMIHIFTVKLYFLFACKFWTTTFKVFSS